MPWMEHVIRHGDKRFTFALLISLALHAVLIAIKPFSDREAARRATGPKSPVVVTLPKQAPPLAQVAPETKPPAEKPSAHLSKRPALITAPEPTWTMAEREEMKRFLDELDTPSKPRSGRELEQSALAMARTMPPQQEEDDDLKEMMQKLADAKVEPYSLEMYFDALFRKMNRSAAMVSNERVAKGKHVAAVRITVNQDGSVKNFRVLWAADQQAEIAYIKAVVDQAAPFPVFPTAIRDATNAIVLQVCILPGRYGDGGGATFTRMSKGQGCREPDY